MNLCMQYALTLYMLEHLLGSDNNFWSSISNIFSTESSTTCKNPGNHDTGMTKSVRIHVDVWMLAKMSVKAHH
jgi:hypothetical protein